MMRDGNLWKKLAITLVFGLVFVGQVSSQTKFGPKTEPFIKMFTSGTIHIKSTMSGAAAEAKTEIETFMKGDRTATVMSAMGMTTRIVMRDKKTYMINESQKMIMITSMQDAINTGITDTDGLVFTGSGTAVFAGKNLPYEEYSTKDEEKLQYFVDGNKLAGMRTFIFDEAVLDIVISVMDQNVPDSAFNIPTSGYQIMDMSN